MESTSIGIVRASPKGYSVIASAKNEQQKPGLAACNTLAKISLFSKVIDYASAQLFCVLSTCLNIAAPPLRHAWPTSTPPKRRIAPHPSTHHRGLLSRSRGSGAKPGTDAPRLGARDAVAHDKTATAAAAGDLGPAPRVESRRTADRGPRASVSSKRGPRGVCRGRGPGPPRERGQ